MEHKKGAYISVNAASITYGIAVERLRTLVDLEIIDSNDRDEFGKDLIVEGSLRDYIQRSLDLGRLP